MNRVRAFFVEEATECLDNARQALSDTPDSRALHAAVRKLRGSAQVARFGALADEARALETRLKEAGGGWSPELTRIVASGLERLTEAVAAVRDGRIEQDEREPMDEQTEQGSGDVDVVPIETLEYRGAAALERAATLREPLEDAIVNGEPPGTILDELFDLIRLGGK